MEKREQVNTFIDEIAAIPGGEKIHLCMQCGSCTASCPSADKMDHAPSELIAMIGAGLRREVLSSNSMWYCLSCYMCTVRCPRGIRPTNIMHILEYLAEKDGLNSRHTLTPTMYRTFNQFVRSHGIIPEVRFMSRYYLKTNFLKAAGMARVAFELLRHGRINLKTRRLSRAGGRQLKAILDMATASGSEK
jgi:heterodisulfide reductase subunit C